jgi:hypothetical protein
MARGRQQSRGCARGVIFPNLVTTSQWRSRLRFLHELIVCILPRRRVRNIAPILTDFGRLVVLFHAFPKVVRGGFVGVDVFFVIGGYLITGIILSGLRSSDFRFSVFYARRARRLLPALVVVLAGMLAIGGLFLLPAAYRSPGLHALAGALFFSNFLSWGEVGYFDAAADAMRPRRNADLG